MPVPVAMIAKRVDVAVNCQLPVMLGDEVQLGGPHPPSLVPPPSLVLPPSLLLFPPPPQLRRRGIQSKMQEM